jgi:hypothetical protein
MADDHQPALIDWLRKHWSRADPDQRRLVRRLVYTGAVCLALIVAALIVANSYWREDVSRSAIAVVTLLLIALTALLFFGAKGPKTIVAVAALVVALVGLGGGTIDVEGVLPDGPVPRGAVICPDLPDGDHFHGTVAEPDFGYTHLRAEPSLDGDIGVRYWEGCEVAFDRWCLGEPKSDWRFEVPDPVWLHVVGADPDPQYIASADIKARPAFEKMDWPAHRCPGGNRLPRQPELTAPTTKRISGPVEIAAAAPDAVEVGFAVYFEETPGRRQSASWHQIGIDFNTDDGITADWDTRSVPGQGRPLVAPVRVLAVPCLGLEFPAEEEVQRSYLVVNHGGRHAAPMPLPLHSLGQARLKACDNDRR